MKLRDALPLLFVAACGARDDHPPVTMPVAAVPAALAAAEPPAIIKGVPHGSDILRIAVTEEGDAALTVDGLNSLRLWPTLDGSRMPVPISAASEIRDLALLQAGTDLVAVVLDIGGAVQLTRISREGQVLGHTQLDGSLYVEAIAHDGGILTRTSDHTVELFAIDGSSRGRLIPDPGERVTDIAARHGRAAAIVTSTTGTRLRWIAPAPLAPHPTLQWDVSFALPAEPLPGMFAIAPTRRRVAYVLPGSQPFNVVDVDLAPVPVAGNQMFLNMTHNSLGFLDDDTVAVSGATLLWWHAAPQPAPKDPWETQDPAIFSSPVGAFADGKVVSARGASLALIKPSSLEYLGWDAPANGGLTVVGSQLVLNQTAAKFLWLDDKLQRTRAFDLENHRGDATYAYGVAIGDHHVISQAHQNETSTLSLIDVDKPEAKATLVEHGAIDHYWPANGLVAVTMRDGRIRRFKLDLESTTVTELAPALRLSAYSVSFLRSFDPERADGLVGVAVTWKREMDERQTLTYFHLVDGKIKTTEKKFDGVIMRADPDGTLVVIERGHHAHLRVMRNDKILRDIERLTIAQPIGIDGEAKHFALRDNNDVVLLDELGQELWRHQLWGASNVLLTPDAERVIVAAPGGLVVLDGKTGEQLARECGFDFGLHASAPDHSPQGFAPVCEDPIVQ